MARMRMFKVTIRENGHTGIVDTSTVIAGDAGGAAAKAAKYLAAKGYRNAYISDVEWLGEESQP